MKTIKNFFQITNTVATSGQPTKQQFELIQQAGYQHIINFSMPDSDNALVNEGSIVSALSMNYFHIPVPWNFPTLQHLKKFSRLMQPLEEEKVWVHCALNMRASAFMFQYLTQIKGLSSEKAKSPILIFH